MVTYAACCLGYLRRGKLLKQTRVTILTFLMLAWHVVGITHDERYSFSLTTFDPNGRLGQVDWAQQAASMGTPVIAMVLTSAVASNDSRRCAVILASPQALPGLFMIDDGTPRFTQITDHLMVTHSGLSADGRVLLSAARKIAIEHEYTFDEKIPCSIFLEEMSLLMQEYTMKPGTRPFGSSLVVAYIPPSFSIEQSSIGTPSQLGPRIFRIDVSGNVEALDDCAIINGNNYLQRTGLQEKLEQLASGTCKKHEKDFSGLDWDKVQTQIVAVIRESLNQETLLKKETDSTDEYRIDKMTKGWTILTACLSSYKGKNSFTRKRHYP